VSDQTAGAPVVPAATILLLRDAPLFEVLMVKRHHQIDFAAGALVFPGGKIHASDHNLRWAGRTVGWDATPAEQRALRIAAIREAYEETGILLARHADGGPFRGHELAGARRPTIVAAPDEFLNLLEEMDLTLDLAALTVFARWITPTMMPKRFDTWFFLAAAPPDQLAQCDGWETVDAEWIGPSRALALAAAGERSVIFPTRMNLKLLAESASASEATRRADARTLVTVEPRMIDGPDGRFLVIPSDAGYGEVSVPASSLP
jgi:8-oxo-dGTP pyrophosphatase MutT (NUDIX family)